MAKKKLAAAHHSARKRPGHRTGLTRQRLGSLADLAIPLTIAPMEAVSVLALPGDAGWPFEPKWDGFRCFAFRAGQEIEIKAKSGKSPSRFFPEFLDNLRALPQQHFALDGELVIPVEGELSFDALQMRLHPAESRIRRLAVETPATLVAFDCLLGARHQPLLQKKFEERRKILEKFLTRSHAGISLTQFTRDLGRAKTWLANPQVALDGVIAKHLDLPYRPGERAMLKVKRLRTADCVVGGFRYAQQPAGRIASPRTL